MTLKIICKRLALVILASVMLTACANLGRKGQANLKGKLASGEVDAAIALVKSDKFFPEERSRLLKLMELGTLHQIKGENYQSLLIFNQARELSDKLFTVSVSKKVASALINGNSDNYYGEIHERSLIRFYQALNHFLLYQKGMYESHLGSIKERVDGKIIDKPGVVPEKKLSRSQRARHLAGARAVLLEWDSVLNDYKSIMSGKTTYKVDLSSRVFGGFIHEQLGTSSDRQIAIKLYQDAKDILFKNYNLYPSYNHNYQSFIRDYKKLPRMSRSTVAQNYVQSTNFSKTLLNYLDRRIKALKKRRNTNVAIVFQEGYVAEKKARLIHYELPVGFLPNSGDADFFSFTLSMLNVTAGTAPSITFELPEVERKKMQGQIAIKIKNKKGKTIVDTAAVLINPISDIAYQALDTQIGNVRAKIGARVAGKHIAAIGAAYASYKLAKSKGTYDFVAKLGAAALYAISNKAIAASEKADLRFWSTLPHAVSIASAKLRPGNYDLFVNEGGTYKKYKEFNVKEGKSTLLNVNVL